MAGDDIRYPSGDNWAIRVLRFLNALDPDHNMLSPVRIQAWLTTIGAICAVDAADLSQAGGQMQAGGAVVYAVLAHVIHFIDKKQRARPPANP